ncbi:MAG: hypothetical protein Q9Q13_04875 [Acidobacteriota bacterium]|nr:hypothetical protein [Acidobacteriota bacterium]
MGVGALTLALTFLPLVTGYALLQRWNWQQIVATGIYPASVFYGGFPLQIPRLLVLSLFALDLAFWLSLWAVSPLGEGPRSVFVAARHRLRRRRLLAHAPLVPVGALIVGARLYAEALSLSGAGATWFEPARLAGGDTSPAASWVYGESLLLTSLAACFGVHLSLLAGLARPGCRLRNMLLLLAAAAGLTAVARTLVQPLADGGLTRAMNASLDRAEATCPTAASAEPIEAAARLYAIFIRTTADTPGLRRLPAAWLPPTTTALPPLPVISDSGLAVVLRGDALPSGGERGGFEYRLRGDGTAIRWPGNVLPCPEARIFKGDRGLGWPRVLEAFGEIGEGPLTLAFRPAPLGRPLSLPGGPPLVLRLARQAAAGSANAPPPRLPLPFRRPLASASAPSGAEKNPAFTARQDPSLPQGEALRPPVARRSSPGAASGRRRAGALPPAGR